MAKAPKKQNKPEEAVWAWEGTDAKGKRMKGNITAANEAAVKAELRRMGVNPLKVKKKAKPLFGGAGKKITPKDIAIFMRQLATMMAAGVPLVQAFDIVGRGHENPKMQDLILTIKADIEGGNTLSDSLKKHPIYFDDLTCNLIEAGEHAGILEALLDKIATYKEKTEAIKAKIKKALTYPIAVIVVACIVTAILLIFVVPVFEELFSSFGADLPAFTQMVIDLSRFMQTWWWAVLGVLVAISFAHTQAKRRSKKYRDALDIIALKFPIFGPILVKAAIARFARTLSTMFAAGVPLVEAMVSVAGACGNVVFYNATMEMRDDVATGQQLQLAMRNSGLFPNMVVQMVAIGEESGSLDAMLGKVADFYEAEVDDAVDNLSSLMEPLIMAFLGVVVGGLVVAMYLPIFKLGTVI
ncbi:MAG: type II secretion system F family protein [Gammaproteobacteria bacterium]|nr:type II secretion system F family protein [Gammaproteobacteria bacterium]